MTEDERIAIFRQRQRGFFKAQVDGVERTCHFIREGNVVEWSVFVGDEMHQGTLDMAEAVHIQAVITFLNWLGPPKDTP